MLFIGHEPLRDVSQQVLVKLAVYYAERHGLKGYVVMEHQHKLDTCATDRGHNDSF